jgi:hypothetical protein
MFLAFRLFSLCNRTAYGNIVQGRRVSWRYTKMTVGTMRKEISSAEDPCCFVIHRSVIIASPTASRAEAGRCNCNSVTSNSRCKHCRTSGIEEFSPICRIYLIYSQGIVMLIEYPNAEQLKFPFSTIFRLKRTMWPLVRKGTIPIERLPLVG